MSKTIIIGLFIAIVEFITCRGHRKISKTSKNVESENEEEFSDMLKQLYMINKNPDLFNTSLAM